MASAPHNTATEAGDGRIAAALVVIAIALLVVGAVSGTVIRHVLQIVPILLVAALLRTTWAYARPAALTLAVFWLLLMSLIWMYLLGISRIARGTYSPTEIAMTLVIGASALYVIAQAWVRPWPSKARAAAAVLLVFLVQYAVLMVSFSKAIAND